MHHHSDSHCPGGRGTFGRLLPVVAAALFGSAMTAAASHVFVANADDDTVSVISQTTGAVVDTIAVGDNPRHVAAAPDGMKVYVVNADSGSVSVIDTSSLAILATVPVGAVPEGVAIDRHGRRLYVSDSGAPYISVIDLATHSVIDTIETPKPPYAVACHPIRDEIWVAYGSVGTVMEVYSLKPPAQPALATLTSFNRLFATALAFTPDGKALYAAESCGFCGRFHLLSGEHANGTIRVIQPDIFYDGSGSATAIAINPVSGFAFLAKQGQNGVPTIIEHSSRSVRFSAPPYGMAVTPDASRLYVTNAATSGFVSIVDTATMTTVSTINAGNSPRAIGIFGSPGELLVANSGGNNLSLFSATDHSSNGTIGVGGSPRHLAVSPDGTRAWVVNSDSNNVSVIDAASSGVVATIPVGDTPEGIAISPDGQRVYVSNSGSSTISVIDSATNAVLSSVSTPAPPYALACHPLRDEIWVGFGTVGTVMNVYAAAPGYPVLASLMSNVRLYGTALAFTPDGRHLLAAESCGHCGRFHHLSGDYQNGTIKVVRPDLFYDNSGSATGIAINPVTGLAYMAKQGQNGAPAVLEYSPRSVTFSAPPWGMAVTADGSRLYVANGTTQGAVSVVNTATMETVATMNVGNTPRAVAIAPSALVAFEQVHPHLSPSGDDNGNGLTNYYEYAAGADPEGADGSAGLSVIPGDGFVRLQFSHRTNASDAHFHLDGSPDLLAWSRMIAGTDYTEEASAALGPNRKRITLRIAVTPGAAPRRFWRQAFSSTPTP